MPAVVFAFDQSGSMGAFMGNAMKIDHAKKALKTQLSRLSSSTPVGLVVFPYKQTCDVGRIYSLANGNKAKVQAYVDRLQPTFDTPLAEAIDQACKMARAHGASTNVVILTDGQETCGGNPEAVAAKWRRAGLQIDLHIIGFGVDAYTAQALKRIAKAGGGTYYDAQNARQLSTALGKAAPKPRSEPRAKPKKPAAPASPPQPVTFNLAENLTWLYGVNRKGVGKSFTLRAGLRELKNSNVLTQLKASEFAVVYFKTLSVSKRKGISYGIRVTITSPGSGNSGWFLHYPRGEDRLTHFQMYLNESYDEQLRPLKGYVPAVWNKLRVLYFPTGQIQLELNGERLERWIEYRQLVDFSLIVGVVGARVSFRRN